MLNIYEEAFRRHPGEERQGPPLAHRARAAHHAADIPRFGQLGVIASMEGIHCTSDAPFVLARLGPKRAEEGAYVWQKLMKSGAVIANGTDAPVEDIDPIASFHASVARKLKDGSVFYPDAADEPDGGAALLHGQRGVRRLRGRHQGVAARPASSRTSPCSRRTS